MLSIVKSCTEPSVRGSKLTAEMLASAVLSRTRAARKNVVSSVCSIGGELQASARMEPATTDTTMVTERIAQRDIQPLLDLLRT